MSIATTKRQGVKNSARKNATDFEKNDGMHHQTANRITQFSPKYFQANFMHSKG